MTPAARQAAAIEILDRVLAGQPAEQALTRWARASRFAGSGDREAVRDLVFRAIRQRRSVQALGGGARGRAMVLGMLRADGLMPDWTGTQHSPAPLDEAEAALLATPLPQLSRAEAGDCPDWLLPHFDAALGAEADAVLALMRDRAPVFLRVNVAQATLASVQSELAGEGVETRPHPLAPQALEVTANPRRVRNSAAYREGRVELQDVASQAVAGALAAHLMPGTRVLDYCAGGGGKALALAAAGMVVSAHDADPARMRDLPERARRAGASIAVLPGRAQGLWPVVLADAPCSGSGSWRRAPEAKWALTPERLDELCALQAQILRDGATLTAPGGVLAYATCSMFEAENGTQIADFQSQFPSWTLEETRCLTPLDGGDGFFLAILRQEPARAG
ncbi:MAG: RsmB/NOP family class I SAM-dependent RNA methyltransferase [Pararhodobacter sp.]|nr:RsmB/NOP family class I SAM-dependent RNA methyltransferase [Pararhodobacter sp.]